MVNCSFTVLENNTGDRTMNFLLGLDMLKRFQCQLDLRHNRLLLEAGGKTESVPFLTEKDLPEEVKEKFKEKQERKESQKRKEKQDRKEKQKRNEK